MNVATRRQISARSAASEQSNPFISPVPSTARPLRRRVERHHACAPGVGGHRDGNLLATCVESEHGLLACRKLLRLRGHGAPVDGDTVQAFEPAVEARCRRVVQVGPDCASVSGLGHLSGIGE